MPRGGWRQPFLFWPRVNWEGGQESGEGPGEGGALWGLREPG